MSGRFAPSPTGDLHLGNLRTAVVAWLSARAAGRGFILRNEDLDRVQSKPEIAERQRSDLAAIGIDWDGEVVNQSDRFDLYEAAIRRLSDAGHVYECFCSRRDIRREIEASSQAPHGVPGGYPGTCRDLSDADKQARRATGRPAALRLRTDGQRFEFDDVLHGPNEGGVDDVVLRRNDGVPAYNLAVVVDDGAQGITEVVRGDDLLPSTPRQILLQRMLSIETPIYLHVPLVIGEDGERLAKRHGAVTIADLRRSDVGPDRALGWIAESLGLAAPDETVSIDQLVDRFDPDSIPRDPVVLRHLGPDDGGRGGDSTARDHRSM